jgi:multidrug efflux pump subunit AcrB
VVNNAILLVEYIERGRRGGMALEEAIVAAGAVRLRPILMTTLITVAGMAPLAVGMGAGADMMPPLALAVAGGLLSAMLLTLFLVPCLYLIAEGIVAALRRALLGDRRRHRSQV